MPWVRLDDHFDEHPKLSAVGPLGIALFVTGLAYCNRNLTDGFIPWGAARGLLTWEYIDGESRHFTIAVTSGHVGDDVASARIIDLLLDAGLWEEAAGGYQIHDYDQYQPSKESVMADREAAKDRMSRVRANKGKRSVDVQPNNERSSLYPVSDPDPVPKSVSDPIPEPTPDPKLPPSQQKKRFTAVPSTVRTRLWGVYTDLTARLTPPPYDEEQFEHWEGLGCTEAHIDGALAEVAKASPSNKWSFFKARLGEALAKAPTLPADGRMNHGVYDQYISRS